MRDLLLYIHILSAFLIVAGAGIASAAGIRTATITSLESISLLAGLQIKSERFLIIPGALLAIITGSWLVNEVGYSFSEPWISAAYAAWIAALGIGTGILTPHSHRIVKRAEECIAAGETTNDDVIALARSKRGPIFGNIENLLLLLFLYLMVFKPGA